ncbi:MAG: sulfite exporter TauE/SafE family protein [Planctomycetales bacterium]|nr:sulfite exporter TauE/SafE family protein [Planctomycetales bacterium]
MADQDWTAWLNLQSLWAIVILALAAFLQATVGFAAALFGLPLLLWIGIDLVQAQVLIITAMLPQNLISLWHLRKSIELREVIVPAAIRIGTLPIGIVGLGYVMSWSAVAINQLVGAIILLAVFVQGLVGIEWRSASKPHWIVITFGGSGILQGLSGMSGPPMVLWVHGQRFSADKARAFLFAMYISNFIPQMGLLTYRFGEAVWQGCIVAVASLPVVMISAMLGLKLGSWLGDRWIRPITYAFLIALAVASLLKPLLQ